MTRISTSLQPSTLRKTVRTRLSSLVDRLAGRCPSRLLGNRNAVGIRTVHVRRVVEGEPRLAPEGLAMGALFRAFFSRRAYERAQRAARAGGRPLARDGRIHRLPWPLSGWTATRDMPSPPAESFRDWWARERGSASEHAAISAQIPAWQAERHRAAAEPGGARETVLARLHAALADRPDPAPVARDYRRRDDRSRAELADLFVNRVTDYRAEVWRTGPGELAELLASRCRARGVVRLAAPPDLAPEWTPEGIELVPDELLSARELDALDGALTGSALAIAETGTIVLDGGRAQGRRALSLMPDYHLCIVDERNVVALVAEAVERLAAAVAEARPLVFVSGPSATSDIELSRVEGVHGPRTLDVVLIGA